MTNFSLSGAVLAALVALGGCSASQRAGGENGEPPAQRTYSAEDRRVAQALSVGGVEARGASSPRSYAMLCALALETINDRLLEGDVLPAEQRRAFASARSIYQQRATAGLSVDEQDALRKEVEAAHPDASGRARFGIGCLRALAGG